MTTTTKPDPFITYRYADGRQVEAQCSSAHTRIASGAAPLEADRMAYVEWCRENGFVVPDHVPATILRDPGAEEDAVDRTAAAASREILGTPPVKGSGDGNGEGGQGEDENEGGADVNENVPQKIPADFPHAAELAKSGITTFDQIPKDPTTVKGIGRVGARLIADSLARR